jgi:nicotinamidase-related amidase
MQSPPTGSDITCSALIILDMQNDFLHPDGSFRMATEHPEYNIDMPFLVGTIPHVKRLADTFWAAGRPVVYVAHVLKAAQLFAGGTAIGMTNFLPPLPTG